MRELFKGKPSDAESAILLREELLLPKYAPPEIIHREGEIDAIAAAIKPLLDKKTPNNLFIHGNSGTGKTTSMKHVLGELKAASSRVIPVYLNCWEFKTKTAVYTMILRAFGGSVPRRGLATDETLEEILAIMEKDDTGVLLVLDELDALVFNNEQEVLYNLSRTDARFGIIGITCNGGLLAKIDNKITSSLRFTDLEFKPYSTQQIADILAKRAKASLAKGSWDFDILEACAGMGKVNGGNARLALEMLWKAAQLAEKRGAKKIELDDVKEASSKSFYQKIDKADPVACSFDLMGKSLSEEERLIVEILAKGETNTTEIYDQFTRKKQKTKRQIRNYLDILEAKGLVEILEDTNAEKDNLLKPRLVRLKAKQ